MNELYIFATSAFFFWTIREIFFWTTVWQQNEYRIDRFLLYLKAKEPRQELFYSPQAILKYILFFGYIATVFYDNLSQTYQILVFGLYIFLAVLVLKDIYRNAFKKPLLTLQPILIIVLTLGTIVLFYSLQLMDKYFWLILLDILICPLVTLFVLIFSFPTEIYRDIQTEKAAKLLAQNNNLIIIGVTGSYGKSAVKDYITEILKKKYIVLKTQGKNNTAFGIANTVIKGLKKDTQIFVAEIGGYKRGEVRAVTSILHPHIGVITGINTKYLSLFGNLENKKKANYELIESLPKNGLALCAGNNKNTANLFKKTKKTKALYGYSQSMDIFALNIIQKQKTLTFDVHLKSKTLHFPSVKIHPHDLENILPAIYIAEYLGIKEVAIKEAISGIHKAQ